MFLGILHEVMLALLTCVAIDLSLHNNKTVYGPKSLHEALEGLNWDEFDEEKSSDNSASVLDKDDDRFDHLER